MELAIIAAVADNGVIGRDGSIPWDLPEEMEHFRTTTTGHPVIMGRTTWEEIEQGLDGPLPGRTNVVVSHEELPLPDGVVNVHGIDAAVEAAEEHGDRAFIIGGASIYKQMLDRADTMILSELHDPYPGDTVFPELDEEVWQEADRQGREGFDIVTYRRVE